MNRDTILVAGVIIIMQLSLALMVDAIFGKFAVTLAAVGFSLTLLLFLYIVALYATERIVAAITQKQLQETDITLAKVLAREIKAALSEKPK